MSYGRSPYYIYDDVERDAIMFDFVPVPNKVVNAFLFKLLMVGRREELKERLLEGRDIWETQYQKLNDKWSQYWLNKNTDDLLKELMGVPNGNSNSQNDTGGITGS
jgi:hypothetical protein